MDLYIDASNIITGGGRTHLIELLRNCQPELYGFNRVVLYGHRSVNDLVAERPWLERITHPLFNYGYPGRSLWQFLFRRKRKDGVWFVPGGGSAPGPYVTMCQNLLPLDKKERDRYFFSLTWVRLVILGWLHRRAFKSAAGVIFLNQYSLSVLGNANKRQMVSWRFIPHGVSEMFNFQLKNDRAHDSLRLIYVSTIDVYKHQWKIAQAVQNLINERYKIEIDFIGSAYPRALNLLAPFLGPSIRYHGSVEYRELPDWYRRSDVFIFASTCETFGMVLLEAMASGLPVLCSRYSSMPETLEGNALYFDSLDTADIKRVIRLVYTNRELLKEFQEKGLLHVKRFSWEETSSQTFKFLAACAKREKLIKKLCVAL